MLLAHVIGLEEPAAARYCQIHFGIRNYKEEMK